MVMGKLYLVGTPIGNLEDITLRALRILEEVEYIACEDTRVALKLLNHLNIKKKLISYEKYSELEKQGYILDLVEAGSSVALISDAGMPGISDPGGILATAAYNRGINPVIIPGPSALTSAVAVSGLNSSRFFFQGFLPKGKNKERMEVLKELTDIKAALVFYISPHSLLKDLTDISKVLGNPKAALARELTKYYEEVIRDDLKGLIGLCAKREIKGEIVLVVEGNISIKEEASLEEQYNLYLKIREEKGLKSKEAIKELAFLHGFNKNRLYEYVLNKDSERNKKE